MTKYICDEKKGSGYSGFSKSNNAIEAEKDGKFPASIISKKLNIPIEVVKAVGASEWHHTSSHYNETSYYDLEEVQEFASTAEGKALVKKFKNETKEVTTFLNSTVEWLDWSGSRKRPVCTEMKEAGCQVVVKGKTATITLKDDTTFTKRLSTNGFYFTK